MDFLELAQKRYSCRKFDTKPVEREKTEKIIKAAISAPTAVNRQPFKIWIIESPKELEKMTKVTPFTFGAPIMFVVGANPAQGYVRKFDNRNFCDIDATIAATHLMLEIADLGLGTTWVGHFNPEELKKAFPQMKDYDIVGLFPAGYPALDAAPSEMHFNSKSEKEIVEEI